MNWEIIPLVGDKMALYWAPVLDRLNAVLESLSIWNAQVVVPSSAVIILILIWVLIRALRKGKKAPKKPVEKPAKKPAKKVVKEEEPEEDLGEGLTDEEIERELAGVVEPEEEEQTAEPEKPVEEELEAAEQVAEAEEIPVVEEQEEAAPEPAPPPKLSFFQRLKVGLAKTSAGLVGKIDAVLGGRKAIDDALYTDLEEALITADIGVQTAYKLLAETQAIVKKRGITAPEQLRDVLKEQVLEIMKSEAIPLEMSNEKPFVIMVVGVNGVGKTTTIGKMAAKYRNDGKQVLIAAGDTFRAAAIEQLEIWSQRVGCEMIKQGPGADPSAVAFDALQAAKARGADVVILDTAGRLHTKANLMEELKKIKRVMAKVVPTAPHETALVLDATTGQNAINQAKTFNEAIDLTGIILTKLDGTSKGGCIVGICDELHVPIRFIGIGEQIDDLRPFDAVEFVDAMFEPDKS
jgi:fused signal recognition particle receptor